MNSSPLIEVAELLKIRNNSDIVIIDASNGVNARSNFNKLHLENALFVDLNSQLAEVHDDLSKGGRHPLPSFYLFEDTLSSLGISEKSHVIIYDQSNSSNAAARFWWMLTAIGHSKVQVLNGGFNNALKQNYPSNNSLNTVKRVGVYIIEKIKGDKVILKKAGDDYQSNQGKSSKDISGMLVTPSTLAYFGKK